MKFFYLTLLFVVRSFAAEEPVPAIPQLVDIFLASASPGSGALSYKFGDEKTEKIVLGRESGYYGLGLIFDGSDLPDPFRKELGKRKILQIALGTFKAKEDEKVPQFAAATLLGEKTVGQKTVFRVAVPNSSELAKGPLALLLFTSPALKPGSSDEEKLKETLFADSGSLIVTQQGLKTVSVIKNKGGKYSFYRQEMKIDWSATLGTPFSTTKRSVIGTTVLPFFWPKDRTAQKLVHGIAAQSLMAVGAGSKGFSTKK